MSVENFDQLDGALAFLGEDTPEHCFKCRKPLAGITVLWYGGERQSIGLHPECASSLWMHLIKDSFIASRIAAGKPVLTEIVGGLSDCVRRKS